MFKEKDRIHITPLRKQYPAISGPAVIEKIIDDKSFLVVIKEQNIILNFEDLNSNYRIEKR